MYARRDLQAILLRVVMEAAPRRRRIQERAGQRWTATPRSTVRATVEGDAEDDLASSGGGIGWRLPAVVEPRREVGASKRPRTARSSGCRGLGDPMGKTSPLDAGRKDPAAGGMQVPAAGFQRRAQEMGPGARLAEERTWGPRHQVRKIGPFRAGRPRRTWRPPQRMTWGSQQQAGRGEGLEIGALIGRRRRRSPAAGAGSRWAASQGPRPR